MMRSLASFAALVSVVFFPWQLTVLLALLVAFIEPLVPLVVGIGMDLLYYAPHANLWPHWSLGGLGVTLIVFFVRSRLQTGSIEG